MKCRLCGGEGRVMFKLSPTPIANSFPAEPQVYAPKHPLELQECFTCGHVQLKDFIWVDWVDYRYATPEASRPHLAAAAADLKHRYPNAKTVLEIGCNNGLYMQELEKVGFEVTGIDPCGAGDIIPAPFSSSLAKDFKPFDLIVANNVLAHVDDMADVLNGIDICLKDDGALIFEVQYLPDMLRTGSFDMIYHEHRDYWQFGEMKWLRRHGLVPTAFKNLPTHGGSIRVYCERPGIALAHYENQIDWRKFSRRIESAKKDILSQLKGARKVAAFGATAKACTLLHHFGLEERIAYCVDNTPAKQGRFIPGTEIRILPESHLRAEPPDAVLLTAWNYEQEITSRFPDLNFVVPFKQQKLMEAA